ncbi:very short patch repair endonuclease, partial [Candidatus Woesearchaeota archaeon]|nr:very short patch repair endonuclease [Candidatus Woesearchaeota archaeon]
MKSKNQNKWGITKEFLIEEYVNRKKSLPTIAKENGMSYETLFWYKKKFGIPSHSVKSWHIGKRRSPKTEFRKGMKPWNKDKSGVMPEPWNKGKKLSKEYKQKVSEGTKRAMNKPEIRAKIRKTQFKKCIIPWNKDKTGVYSQEVIEKLKIARLHRVFPKKNTKIELVLFKLLKELDVEFHRHIAVGTICQADAFVPPNCVIFADGDYWHSNPNKYPKPKTPAQIKNRKRDIKTNNKLILEGFTVLR